MRESARYRVTFRGGSVDEGAGPQCVDKQNGGAVMGGNSRLPEPNPPKR